MDGLKRYFDIRPGELGALAWAFAYFFFLLSAYYILRPLRDEMGVAVGPDRLQWLFTATFVAMPCTSVQVTSLPSSPLSRTWSLPP